MATLHIRIKTKTTQCIPQTYHSGICMSNMGSTGTPFYSKCIESNGVPDPHLKWKRIFQRPGHPFWGNCNPILFRDLSETDLSNVFEHFLDES